ncbi:threonylcarbamoyl-AMP synthase-like [Babylonia areolata]|uniref:threonylcarbamoyl-AMP synthase-like n=1 Tax=Babylonia areolata TaxID=304850 RepID=UPI003FD41E29
MNRVLWRRLAFVHNFRFSSGFVAFHKQKERALHAPAMAKPQVVRIPDRCELQHMSGEEERALQVAVQTAVRSLQKGSVVAVPTDTIYGIAGLAQNSDAIRRIYNIKNRNCTKPVAISVGYIDDVYRWSKVVVPREVLEDLLPGPVTVVSERSVELNPELNPTTRLIGIRIPDHAFMQKLSQACDGPIALTSANRSAAQSTLTLDEFEYLWPQLDLLVDGGVLNDTDKARLGSTVVDLSEAGKFRVIREGSAYKRTVDILKNKHKMEEILLPS